MNGALREYVGGGEETGIRPLHDIQQFVFRLACVVVIINVNRRNVLPSGNALFFDDKKVYNGKFNIRP